MSNFPPKDILEFVSHRRQRCSSLFTLQFLRRVVQVKASNLVAVTNARSNRLLGTDYRVWTVRDESDHSDDR